MCSGRWPPPPRPGMGRVECSPMLIAASVSVPCRPHVRKRATTSIMCVDFGHDAGKMTTSAFEPVAFASRDASWHDLATHGTREKRAARHATSASIWRARRALTPITAGTADCKLSQARCRPLARSFLRQRPTLYASFLPCATTTALKRAAMPLARQVSRVGRRSRARPTMGEEQARLFPSRRRLAARAAEVPPTGHYNCCCWGWASKDSMFNHVQRV